MQPLVSVRVATYNHENYIAKCIESILMQKTNFPFEIVIGEDGGADRTRQIVLAYQLNYPDKIKTILPEQNIGPSHISFRIQQACQGVYHAMCEGDDFWIDPLKLQKQADLMQAHPDMTFCFTNALVLNESATAARLFFGTPLNETLDFADLCPINTPTSSVMARNDILATLPEWRLQLWCGDILFRLWCAHHGKVGYLNDITSVYRVHSGSMASSLRSRRTQAREEELALYERLDRETHYQHTREIREQIQRVEKRYKRIKYGTYSLFSPLELVSSLGQYARAMARFRSVRWFGDQPR